MKQLLAVLPLLVILVALLPPFRFHVLVAGLIGAALAVAIGGLSAPKVTELFFGGMTQILDIKSVMLFAATAMVLARCGCTNAIMELMTKWFGAKTELIAGAMVLVQATATYMAGIGAANTLVTAPLVFAAVGYVPLAIVGMSIVSGASWATSPSSAEAAYISKQMGISPAEYASFMLPYTMVFWAIGMLLAWYGVRRYRLAGRLVPGRSMDTHGGSGNQTAAKAPIEIPVTNGPGTDIGAGLSAARRATPFFLMLLLILAGPPLNRMIGIPLFSAVLLPFWVLLMTALLLRVHPNRIAEMFVEGGLTILRYMFLVALFLGFIRMLSEIGTFTAIASLVGFAAPAIVLAAALVVAFLIAIPAAAYTVAIDALIIPVLGAVGVPVWAYGFVGIAVAQGAMMSPVQINVAATAHGFKTDILSIVRNNAPYMPFAFLVTLLMATFFAGR
ncbi:MAG: hypothetical protein FJX35_26620 [Alphaproteobacteria bacterium]|nr:hypothetical protein [Alphaproteobacteria bacterium]MBM3601784.1 hypothetical protein [Alphaproteobacteria bacterium]